jgi:hypothetical protein
MTDWSIPIDDELAPEPAGTRRRADVRARSSLRTRARRGPSSRRARRHEEAPIAADLDVSLSRLRSVCLIGGISIERVTT